MSEPFCGDCPDREACASAYPCSFVRKVHGISTEEEKGKRVTDLEDIERKVRELRKNGLVLRWADALIAEVRRLIGELNRIDDEWYQLEAEANARAESAEAEVVTLRARVAAVADEWEADRDVCLEWIADPKMHADEGHPMRLSGMADILNRHAEVIRSALATTGKERRPNCDTCNDTGRCDWAPGEHRDTDEWDRPCIDRCKATTGEGQ